MSQFEADTDVTPNGDGRWTVTPSPNWNIGDNANGGYATSLVVRAAASIGAHRDPLSLTTHFLRPLQPDGDPAEIEIETVRSGRTTTVVRGALRHAGKDRVVVIAALGSLDGAVDSGDGPDRSMAPPPPTLPHPDECTHRSELEQGVVLPILDRVDVRLDPACAAPGASERAVMRGWIRLADGAAPDARTLPLFADAFPPSLYSKLGRIGWVPTVELTVHIRRHPAPGWVLASFECDDLADGRMIETGSLWDANGTLVARSRQLGLLLT